MADDPTDRLDEELELLITWREARKAFLDAKAKAAEDPSYRDSDEYKNAAQLMGTMRSFWRGVRAALTPTVEDGDAVAAVEPIAVSAFPTAS